MHATKTREALQAIAVGGSAHASLAIEAERGDVGVGESGTLIDGDLALKIVAGVNIINGVNGMFDVTDALPWSGAASPALALGTGAAVYALTTGSSATQAFAYSVVPTLYNSLTSMGDSDDVGTIMGLFQALVVASNLL